MHKSTLALASLILSFILLPGSGCASKTSAIPARAKLNFNPDWKLFAGDAEGAQAVDFDDSGWKSVTTPHAWNEDDAFRKSIEQLPTGIAWYRKHFKVSQEQIAGKVFLEFEGIRQGGEFYLNGEPIGRHENGVMAFGFEISNHLKPSPAENVLAVRIDNAWSYRDKETNSPFQWNDRNFNANYGGINKNVYLHTTGLLYQTLPLFSSLGTSGVYIYASDFDIANGAATITAESQINNDTDADQTFTYEAIITDRDGRVIGKISGGPSTLQAGHSRTVRASGRFSNLHFWSWGYGYLYDVATTLKVNGKPVDTVVTRTGFRKTEFSSGQLTLNDRVLQIHGYAQRTTNEWPAVGSCVPAWLSDFSNRLMVESNGNLVRWMHVTPWKQDVESCDRVGLMQSMPAGDSERDPDGERWKARVRLMRDAIIYNRNNPSIVFYEAGNAGISEDHMQEMRNLRNQFDPNGGRAMGCRNMLDSSIAEFGGDMLYINKSANKPMWAMEYCRDEGLRKYRDELTPPNHKNGDGPKYKNESGRAYNHNQDSFAIEDVTRWFDYWQQRPGTGHRVNAGGVNIIFSDSNTHHRGVENYRRSGEVDAMRIPKDAFFSHQVIWDGWVDVEKPRLQILGHWNYAAGTKKDVVVISSADKVELFVNGESKGFGEQSKRFVYTFKDVEWQTGSVRAQGYDAAGTEICSSELKTIGEPVGIRLTPHVSPNGFHADGADLALVDVEVVDADGNRCPTALNTINFTFDGPAEWRGGIAQGPDNFILSQSLPVECGVNRVLIRSTTHTGLIHLSASADGLASADVQIESKPFVVRDGVAAQIASQLLKGDLSRGPTPTGESRKPSRKEVRPTQINAGSNPQDVYNCVDDNESSDWSSGIERSEAWIEYNFASSVTISEVVARFGSFRTRSYPIRITVDGTEVFNGRTPKTLGYATLQLKPVIAGKSMHIQLIGDPSDRDDYGIVEVTGQKDPSVTTAPAKGSLKISEIEFYEPLPQNHR